MVWFGSVRYRQARHGIAVTLVRYAPKRLVHIFITVTFGSFFFLSSFASLHHRWLKDGLLRRLARWQLFGRTPHSALSAVRRKQGSVVSRWPGCEMCAFFLSFLLLSRCRMDAAFSPASCVYGKHHQWQINPTHSPFSLPAFSTRERDLLFSLPSLLNCHSTISSLAVGGRRDRAAQSVVTPSLHHCAGPSGQRGFISLRTSLCMDAMVYPHHNLEECDGRFHLSFF